MRHSILFLSLIFSTASFAFESADSALDFVYEYASDTIWGFDLKEDYSYRVGVMEHNVDTIFNYRELYENNEWVGSTADTIIVPQDYYVFSISLPSNVIFEGQSPFVRYLFLSKKDSTYMVIDTIGEPEHLTKWDTVRTDGRTTKKQAIENLSHMIDFYAKKECPIYDVYLIEDTANFNSIDNADRLRFLYSDLNNTWIFIIDIHEDTCLYVGYRRDREGNVFESPIAAAPFCTQTDLSTIDGFSLVISKTVNWVRDIESNLDVATYPNPASDVVYVSMEDCELSLFSNDGRLLKSTIGNRMPIKEFDPGLYFLKISKDGEDAVKKIIKE